MSGRAASGCATCADEAVAMLVLEVDDRRGLALCVRGGERVYVETALLDGLGAGERVLVHAGTALCRAPDAGAPAEAGGAPAAGAVPAAGAARGGRG